MKKYTLQLKGTKKNNTENLTVTILGDNKRHAFNWAYSFFEKGEFEAPYFATGVQKMAGTEFNIPGVKDMMHLKGKYKVYRTSISVA